MYTPSISIMLFLYGFFKNTLLNDRLYFWYVSKRLARMHTCMRAHKLLTSPKGENSASDWNISGICWRALTMEWKPLLKEIIDSWIHGRILLPEVYFMIDFELTQKYMEILGRSAQFEEFSSQCIGWEDSYHVSQKQGHTVRAFKPCLKVFALAFITNSVARSARERFLRELYILLRRYSS